MSYTTDQLIQIKTNEIRRLHGVCNQKDAVLKRISDAGEEALVMLRSTGTIYAIGIKKYDKLNLAIDEARQTIG